MSVKNPRAVITRLSDETVASIVNRRGLDVPAEATKSQMVKAILTEMEDVGMDNLVKMMKMKDLKSVLESMGQPRKGSLYVKP